MPDGDRRLVPGHPARLGEAVAEVEVLHVHPVALVEEADPVERRAAHEHERSVHRVDRSDLHLRGAVGGERAALAAAADPGEVAEGAQRSGEGSPRRVVGTSVGLLEGRAADADLGALVEECAEAFERPGRDLRVGVESEHVVAVGGADGDVVGGAEAEVSIVGEQAHLRVVAGDHLRGAVAGVVVDDGHGHRPRGAVGEQRLEAAPEQLPAAVGDDDDVE